MNFFDLEGVSVLELDELAVGIVWGLLRHDGKAAAEALDNVA